MTVAKGVQKVIKAIGGCESFNLEKRKSELMGVVILCLLGVSACFLIL